jgi:hypothetical protein
MLGWKFDWIGERVRGDKPWWRRALCLLRLCPHEFRWNNYACWGQCRHCGHIAGYVTRIQIHAARGVEPLLQLPHDRAADSPEHTCVPRPK